MNKSFGNQPARGVVKPRRISLKDGSCIFHSLFKNWVLLKSQVNHVEVGRTISLFDEISITIDCDDGKFFIPETVKGFSDLVQWLNIDEALGSDWYRRAEAGERLVVG